jgi:hypothetical protein
MLRAITWGPTTNIALHALLPEEDNKCSIILAEKVFVNQGPHLLNLISDSPFFPPFFLFSDQPSTEACRSTCYD